MGGTHAQTHADFRSPSDPGEVSVPAAAGRLLVGALIACAVAALAGLWHWWPDSQRLDDVKGSVAFAAEGVRFPTGEVVKVAPRCVGENYSGRCNTVTVAVDVGLQRVTVPPQVAAAGLVPGDELSLLATPDGVYSFF